MACLPVAKLVYGYIIELREYRKIDATLGENNLRKRFMQVTEAYRDENEHIFINQKYLGVNFSLTLPARPGQPQIERENSILFGIQLKHAFMLGASNWDFVPVPVALEDLVQKIEKLKPVLSSFRETYKLPTANPDPRLYLTAIDISL